MEKVSLDHKITISTLGNCVTRDIFRIADRGKKFKLTGNVGFISLLSINAEAPDDVTELIKNIQNCSDTEFNKRCKMLDLTKNIWEYLRENKGEYLLLELSDFRLPVLKRQTQVCTYREMKDEADTIVKKELLKRGFEIVHPGEWKMDEMLSSVQKVCEDILKIWPPDKILFLNAIPVNTLFNHSYIDEGNAFLQKSYANGTYWYMLRRIIRKALSTLKCKEITMPQIQFVTVNSKHLFGLNPFHYTDMVYEYLYEEICDALNIATDKTRKIELAAKLENQYYRFLKYDTPPIRCFLIAVWIALPPMIFIFIFIN